jgi:hypothetical protein
MAKYDRRRASHIQVTRDVLEFGWGETVLIVKATNPTIYLTHRQLKSKARSFIIILLVVLLLVLRII